MAAAIGDHALIGAGSIKNRSVAPDAPPPMHALLPVDQGLRGNAARCPRSSPNPWRQHLLRSFPAKCLSSFSRARRCVVSHTVCQEVGHCNVRFGSEAAKGIGPKSGRPPDSDCMAECRVSGAQRMTASGALRTLKSGNGKRPPPITATVVRLPAWIQARMTDLVVCKSARRAKLASQCSPI